jgi:hypothetical protein
MKKSGIFLLVVLASPSCANGLETLHARAAFDLNCDSSKLHLTELGVSTYGVDGCGKRATYVCKENLKASYCASWVMNTASDHGPDK